MGDLAAGGGVGDVVDVDLVAAGSVEELAVEDEGGDGEEARRREGVEEVVRDGDVERVGG